MTLHDAPIRQPARCSCPMQLMDVQLKPVPGVPGWSRFVWDWNTRPILYASPDPDLAPDVWQDEARRNASLCARYASWFWLRCPTSAAISRQLAEAAPARTCKEPIRPENILPAVVAAAALRREGAGDDDLALLEALGPTLSPGRRVLRQIRRWLRQDQAALQGEPHGMLDDALRRFSAQSVWPPDQPTIRLWRELTARLADFFFKEQKQFEAAGKMRNKAVGHERRGRTATGHDEFANRLGEAIQMTAIRDRLLAHGHGVRRYPLIWQSQTVRASRLALGQTAWRPGLERSLTPFIQDRKLHLLAGRDRDLAVPLRISRRIAAPLPLALILDASASLEDDVLQAKTQTPARNTYEAVLGLGLDILASAPPGAPLAVLTFAQDASGSGWRRLPEDSLALENALFARSSPNRTNFPVKHLQALHATAPGPRALFLIATDGEFSSPSPQGVSTALESCSASSRIVALRTGGGAAGADFFQCVADNGGLVLDLREFLDLKHIPA